MGVVETIIAVASAASAGAAISQASKSPKSPSMPQSDPSRMDSARRRAAGQFSTQDTILGGNSQSPQGQVKKTILGG